MLFSLISDQEIVEVQEQALNLLRNLACTKPIVSLLRC